MYLFKLVFSFYFLEIDPGVGLLDHVVECFDIHDYLSCLKLWSL